jgi:hypothetical protein
MTLSDARSGTRGEQVIPGSLWRHRRKPDLTKEIARITSEGKVLGPSTSRSGRTPSVVTLIRDYEYLGMREPVSR